MAGRLLARSALRHCFCSRSPIAAGLACLESPSYSQTFPVTPLPRQFSLQTPRLSLFGSFLDAAWNKVDRQRVEEVGPEVAAAEWIMRNGGSIKWANFHKWVTDYNQIGLGTGPGAKIEAINATDCSITADGFEYLKGLSALRSVKFHKAHHMDNAALDRLSYVADTLTSVEITSCGNVSDSGIKGLSQLKNLKEIHLSDLPSVKDPQGCVQSLKSSLPGCEVSYT